MDPQYLSTEYWRLRGWAMEAYNKGNESKAHRLLAAAHKLWFRKWVWRQQQTQGGLG